LNSAGTISNSDAVEVLGQAPAGVSTTSATVTTGNVTAARGTHYRLTVSGLTADRNFVLPSGADGDEISFELVTDAPADYDIVVLGDTGVGLVYRSKATATATEVQRARNKGDSMRWVHDGTNWVCSALNDGIQSLYRSATASDDASIILPVNQAASEIQLRLNDVVPIVDTQSIRLTFSVDGGSTYHATGYYLHRALQGVSVSFGSNSLTSNATTGWPITGTIGTNGSENADSVFDITNTGDGGTPFIRGHSIHYGADGNVYREIVVGMNSTETGAWTHIKLESTSGNIESGTFELYSVIR
jgi:hypothetical protein